MCLFLLRRRLTESCGHSSGTGSVNTLTAWVSSKSCCSASCSSTFSSAWWRLRTKTKTRSGEPRNAIDRAPSDRPEGVEYTAVAAPSTTTRSTSPPPNRHDGGCALSTASSDVVGVTFGAGVGLPEGLTFVSFDSNDAASDERPPLAGGGGSAPTTRRRWWEWWWGWGGKDRHRRSWLSATPGRIGQDARVGGRGDVNDVAPTGTGTTDST